MILRALIGKVFNKFIKVTPISYSEEMFYRIGRMLGVRSFTCDKELGLFEGSINDNVVHRYYLRYRIGHLDCNIYYGKYLPMVVEHLLILELISG